MVGACSGRQSKGFPVGPCYGPLLDSVGVCSVGIFVSGILNWYIRILDSGSLLRPHGMDCRDIMAHGKRTGLNTGQHRVEVFTRALATSVLLLGFFKRFSSFMDSNPSYNRL